MFLSRISLNMHKVGARSVVRLTSGGYGAHQLVWALMADPAVKDRDFLYRMELDHHLPRFYVVSKRLPKDPSGLWQVETKSYDPAVRVGQALGFSLRANPIVTKRLGEDRRHTRHDVIMEAKHRLKDQSVPKTEWDPPARIVQHEGLKWLGVRAAKHGFRVSDHGVIADGYVQHRHRKGQASADLRFSTVEFNGVLTVVDPDRFREALLEGIGPCKGFGCGLLLVRRL